jgi:hypothetical protein
MRYRAIRLRGALKASALFAAMGATVILETAGSAQAITIELDLRDSHHITSKITKAFAELNGMALQGQTLSLDFTFSHGEFVRLFSITSDPFVGLLTLHTNSSGVDFLDGTGFFIDQNGQPLEQPQQLGSASGNGWMAAGLFPGDLERPLDFFGIHFDLTLPDSPFISITGEEFVFDSNGNGPFGVGPGVPRDLVPDQDSTVLLLSLGSLALISARPRLTRVG